MPLSPDTLRQRREYYHLTMAQLADYLNLSLEQYSAYELNHPLPDPYQELLDLLLPDPAQLTVHQNLLNSTQELIHSLTALIQTDGLTTTLQEILNQLTPANQAIINRQLERLQPDPSETSKQTIALANTLLRTLNNPQQQFTRLAAAPAPVLDHIIRTASNLYAHLA